MSTYIKPILGYLILAAFFVGIPLLDALSGGRFGLLVITTYVTILVLGFAVWLVAS